MLAKQKRLPWRKRRVSPIKVLIPQNLTTCVTEINDSSSLMCCRLKSTFRSSEKLDKKKLDVCQCSVIFSSCRISSISFCANLIAVGSIIIAEEFHSFFYRKKEKVFKTTADVFFFK
jgi:hypothetical protein